MTGYLVRHGKDDETVRGGWSMQSLTDEGKRQAEALARTAETLALDIKHLYSSDLPRAMETAQPVAEKLGLPIIPLRAFREVNNGLLAGMKNELANTQYPGLFWNTLDWEQPYPGGESPSQFYERICMAWEAFQKRILEQDETVMLVTHGGVIHAILSIINGKAYSNKTTFRKIQNGEIVVLKYQNGTWTEQITVTKPLVE